jgi:hypothetical protein
MLLFVDDVIIASQDFDCLKEIKAQFCLRYKMIGLDECKKYLVLRCQHSICLSAKKTMASCLFALHVLRYLKRTTDQRITFSGSFFDLHAFSDTDWAGDQATRRSMRIPRAWNPSTWLCTPIFKSCYSLRRQWNCQGASWKSCSSKAQQAYWIKWHWIRKHVGERFSTVVLKSSHSTNMSAEWYVYQATCIRSLQEPSWKRNQAYPQNLKRSMRKRSKGSARHLRGILVSSSLTKSHCLVSLRFLPRLSCIVVAMTDVCSNVVSLIEWEYWYVQR